MPPSLLLALTAATTREKFTLLQHATTRRVVVTAYALGADVNSGVNVLHGCTPLMSASWRGFTDAVRGYLRCGVDLEATSFSFDTALSVSISHGHIDVAKLLLEAGASPEPGAFRCAMARLDASFVAYGELLLEWGADVDGRYQGETALKAAVVSRIRTSFRRIGVSRYDPGVIPWLLRHGANPLEQDHQREGCTPLSIATAEGLTDVLPLLQAAVPRNEPTAT